ncbi:unnamed protein product [Musa hybrid cultivar]
MSASFSTVERCTEPLDHIPTHQEIFLCVEIKVYIQFWNSSTSVCVGRSWWRVSQGQFEIRFSYSQDLPLFRYHSYYHHVL